MKQKYFVKIVIGLIMITSYHNSYSQNWILGGNPNTGPNGTGSVSNFLGTKAGNFDALRFGTNGTSRMFMADGGTGATNGFIGLGNGFIDPKSRLHLHQTGNNAIYTQWTNGATNNNNANQGLRIGIATNGDAEIRQQEILPIRFYIGTNQRMYISQTGGQSYLGIGPNFSDPKSMLHIHDGNQSSFQMTDGITSASVGAGFRILQAGKTIKFIQQEIADMIFYTGGTDVPANERMIIVGGTVNNTQGFVGIGTHKPSAPLEVVKPNELQFKVTDHQATSSDPTTAFAYFQVKPTGDLIISPFYGTGYPNSTLQPRFVGIGTIAPRNTLEITSDGASPPFPVNNGTGKSGLRFTNLTASIS